MAGKTQGDKIDELMKQTAILTERLDNLGADLQEEETAGRQQTDRINDLTTRVALLEQRVGDLQKAAEEGSRKRWTLVGPVVGAVVSVLLSALVSFLVAR